MTQMSDTKSPSHTDCRNSHTGEERRRIIASGLQYGWFGLVACAILITFIFLKARTAAQPIQPAPGIIARSVVIGIGTYIVFFTYGASLAFGRCYRAQRKLATMMAGFVPLVTLVLVAACQGQNFLGYLMGLGLPACLVGILYVGMTLWGEGEGISYEKCPTCGHEEKEAVIFRCGKCQHMYCKQCGKYDSYKGGYCPLCESNKRQIMGKII